MAKKKGTTSSSPQANFQDSASSGTESFLKGMNKDYDEVFSPDGSWAYAKNAVNNSIEGDLGEIGNEPSNYLCASAPYTIMGRIHLYDEFWAIFSTDEVNSEIGLYDEDQCYYRTVVNDQCLNFSKFNIITGVSKQKFNCDWSIYFADGKNPDRVVNLGNPDLWPTSTYLGNNTYENGVLWPGVQWQLSCTPPTPIPDVCTVCTPINQLDCDKTRINQFAKVPCVHIDNGPSGGNIYNGSYIAFVAYTVNGQRYGDYTTPSNVQSVFVHDNIGSALEITVSNLDTDNFTEFELVVLSIIDQATAARRIGLYNTADTVVIPLDTIDDTLISVPLDNIILRSPLYDKSDAIFEIANYLLKVGPRTTFDFNYQPLANQIAAKWVVNKYPKNYYENQGYVTGYMRDEVYAFWIRWIYDTGEKSPSYHIPGRYEGTISGLNVSETADVPPSLSIYQDGERYFEVVNTATIDGGGLLPLAQQDAVEDGGVKIATGKMAYWESTERYPDRNPDIWDATLDPVFSGTNDPIYDLCNKPIRHHKMPEDIIQGITSTSRIGTDSECIADSINIVGVQFSNIKPPVYYDDNGQLRVVPHIVGYEILRSSREGNKSVVCKGIINNMRRYYPADGTPGLYQNYPYNPVKALHPGGAAGVLDPTLSTKPVAPDGTNYGLVTANQILKNFFTFHSPDTSFYRPYLSMKELRLYTELGCADNVLGNFEEVPGHPKEKLLTDLALITALIIGIGEAALAMNGKTATSSSSPRTLNAGLNGSIKLTYGTGGGTWKAPSNLAPNTPIGTMLAMGASTTLITGATWLSDLLGGDLANAITGGNFNPVDTFYAAWPNGSQKGLLGRELNIQHEKSFMQALPSIFSLAAGAITFINYTTTAAQNNLNLIKALTKYRQYAYRYISHGYLHKNSVGNITLQNKRRYIPTSGYLSNNYDIFSGYTVNNVYRSQCVALETIGDIDHPALDDNTINSIGYQAPGIVDGPTFKDPSKVFRTTASCYYTGLKLRNRNQYGQIDSIRQIPIPCRVIVNNNNAIPSNAIETTGNFTNFKTTYTSPVLFGGDVYIGRYTEKNTFFYFSDWLYQEPDGTLYNYREKFLALYPRFWVNFEDYNTEGLLVSVLGNLFEPDQWNTPANTNNLDGAAEYNPSLGSNNNDFNSIPSFRFGRKDAYFYLFQSAVRDFYVESEINIAYRDWGALVEERHYPIESNLSSLFDTSIIKTGNYYKINNSVSIAYLFYNVASWGNMQDRDYNPIVAATCNRYLPNRVIYSLPNVLEQKKDFWRVFLPNNYKDYKSPVTAIKPIGKTGALVLFDFDSPIMIQGTETLETDIGTKLTIGDGALFAQPEQSIVNTDASYQYGSCQDTFSIINTPTGIYWISQNQGKVFSMSGNLNEISAKGLRWWFGKFLPFRLLQDFPDFPVTNNPVAGIGCQAIYDNDYLMIYFCKKDYELRKDLPQGTTLVYSEKEKGFIVNGGSLVVELGDPQYFKDVSWTVSYDPKSEIWVSFHDWHPDLTLSSKLNFISTKGNTMWRHNDTTSSYCNFYGVDYPFEVEYSAATGQEVTSLRSIEYLLECFVYDVDGIDRFHLLDFNFDELIVYNTEQVSGLLNLIQAPKDSPFARLNYPQINPTNIDVLYEKVEQKYRVNQFWDVTADRGEYNLNVQRPIWLTEWDGYHRQLNPANLNYNKSVFERKKFRHYFANVLFIRKQSGNVKMLLKIANNKNLNSPR
jgi:hypothetical protein